MEAFYDNGVLFDYRGNSIQRTSDASCFLPLRALQFQYQGCNKKAAMLTGTAMLALLSLLAWLGFILTPIILTITALVLLAGLAVWEKHTQNSA